jgi:hypothetical protein
VVPPAFAAPVPPKLLIGGGIRPQPRCNGRNPNPLTAAGLQAGTEMGTSAHRPCGGDRLPCGSQRRGFRSLCLLPCTGRQLSGKLRRYLSPRRSFFWASAMLAPPLGGNYIRFFGWLNEDLGDFCPGAEAQVRCTRPVQELPRCNLLSTCFGVACDAPDSLLTPGATHPAAESVAALIDGSVLG